MLSSWLASKFAAPIAIGTALLLMLATATLGVKLWVANHDAASAVARAEKAEKDNGTLRVNVTTLTGQIRDTNAKLDQMASDATAREADRVAHDASIDAALSKTTGVLAAIKPGPDKCASASALIKDFAK